MLTSLNLAGIARLLFAIAAILMLSGVALPATAQTTTQGKCSPIIFQSQITGRLSISCEDARPELRALAERLNRLIEETRASRQEVAELIHLLNTFAGAPRSKLGQAMTAYLAFSQEGLLPNENATAYVVPLASAGATSDPAGGSVYQLLVINDPDREDLVLPHCRLSGDAMLLGREVRVRWQGQVGTHTSIIPLPSGDPILTRVCKGLSLPLSAIVSSRGSLSQAARHLTVYDYVSMGLPATFFTLVPQPPAGQRPDDVATPFWHGIAASRVFGAKPAMDITPEAFLAMAAAVSNDHAPSLARRLGFGQRLEFDSALPVSPLALRPGSGDQYPSQMIQDFGADLERMDAAWTKYISAVTVTLGGRQVSLMQNGRPAPLFEPVQASELDKPSFWARVREPTTVLRQITCHATRFAIDEGYASVGDLPRTQECSLPISIQ